MAHDILYDTLLNLDTVSKKLYLFMEIGPSDVKIQNAGGEPESPKNWRLICEGDTKEEIISKIQTYTFPSQFRYIDGTPFDLGDLSTRLMNPTMVTNGFKSMFDILPTELITFTAQDSSAIRYMLNPFSNEDRIFSDDELKKVRSYIAHQLVKLADPTEHEAAEIAGIFSEHVQMIITRKPSAVKRVWENPIVVDVEAPIEAPIEAPVEKPKKVKKKPAVKEKKPVTKEKKKKKGEA